MVVYVSACVIGIFAIEDGRIKEKKLFTKDPKNIAEELVKFEQGENPFEGDARQPNPASEFLKKNMRKLAIDLKYVKDENELNNLIAKVAIEKSKTKITIKERRDKLIIQAVSAVNDLDRIINAMSERIREWYGLHYPELRVKEHRTFVKKIVEHGKRENFKEYSRSMGVELSEADINIIRHYAKELDSLYDLREKLEEYLNKEVPAEMPNVSGLLGPLLAGRMLLYAGSLERFAKMPSSTIQLLGAEKALFKYLKGKENVRGPPKYGILFSHPDISSAPKEKKGKIARLLSAKLTIAARTDFYTKKDISKELLEDYKAKVKEALS